MRLDKGGYTFLEILNSKYETYSLNLSASIHFMQCYRHSIFFVYLFQLYSYINGPRQVSHQHVICTNIHSLVDPNVTYDGPLVSQPKE